MANSLGALVVSLGLDATEFTSGLSKAQYQLKTLNDSVATTASAIKTAFAGIAIYEVAEQFEAMVDSSLKVEAALQHIGDAAGLSGSQLSAFSKSAALSNTSLEDVASMSARLSKALIESSDSTTKSAVVLRALGISAKDAASLLEDPAAGIQRLATVINQLPEGGTKAAAQLLILGRAGGTTSAFLKEVADAGDLVATQTDVQVAAAKRFEDSLTQIGINSANTKTSLANALLPTLQDLADAFLKATTGTGTLKEAIDKLAQNGQFTQFAQGVALGAANAADGIVDFYHATVLLFTGLKTGSVQLLAFGQQLEGISQLARPTQFSDYVEGLKNVREGYAVMTAAGHDWSTQLDEVTHRTTIADAVQKQFATHINAPSTGFAGGSADSVQRRIDSAKAQAKAVQDALNGLAGSKDDPTKALLEAAQKALEASVAQETQLLASRNDVLGKLYGVNLLSIQDYYRAKQTASDDALTAQLSDYAQEIKNQQDFIAKTTSQVAKAKAQGDISDIEKKADAAVAANRKATLDGFFEQIAAVKAYQNSLVGLTAQLQTLSGNSAAAAGPQFDIQNQQLRERLQVQQNTDAQKQLDLLRAQTVAQATLNDIQKAGGTILDVIGTAQARVDLAVQTGNETDLQAYADKSAIAQKYIDQLNKMADAAALAAVTPDQLQAVDNFRLKIEQLGASTDALAAKFRSTFEDAFSTSLDNVINRTKTVKQAVDDFSKSVSDTLTHLATTELAQQLFGKSGPLGGISDYLSNLFGGASSSTANAGISSLGTAALAASPSLDTLTLAAASAAQALLAVAASSGGSAIPGFSGFSNIDTSGDIGADVYDFGGNASGTDSWTGGPTWVGENGKELINLPRGSQVIPNSALRFGSPQKSAGGDTHIYNISVPPGTTGQTANQLASMLAQKISSAPRRGF